MSEMELLTRYRDDVSTGEAAARAERALMEAIRTEQLASERVGAGADRRPARRRTRGLGWRPAAMGGLATAVAGGLIAALVVAPGAAPSADALTVGKLSHLAAAAALRQADVPPGQWVYWEKKFSGWLPVLFLTKGITKVWSTASATRVAVRRHGKLTLARCTRHSPEPCALIGGEAYAVRVVKGWYESFRWKAQPVTYRQLGSLPHNPQALDHYLSALGYGPGGPSTRAFTLIDFMLTTYVMPPRLTAEMYHALGDLPRVTLDRHAVDAAGRHGVGFRIKAGQVRYEIILNPRTYRLMGDEAGSYSASAILRQVLVSGPGKTH
jgi:hypothetical protein